jgi:hypothetical protein
MQLPTHPGRTKWQGYILLKTYYDRFEKHVKPKANPVFARYKFHNKIQGPAEPVEEFTAVLQLLAEDCEFHDQNEMVRD